MGFFDSPEKEFNDELKDFKIYTSDLAFKGEILKSEFILSPHINMYTATAELIRIAKSHGCDAIIGYRIGGGQAAYAYGTAIKTK